MRGQDPDTPIAPHTVYLAHTYGGDEAWDTEMELCINEALEIDLANQIPLFSPDAPTKVHTFSGRLWKYSAQGVKRLVVRNKVILYFIKMYSLNSAALDSFR